MRDYVLTVFLNWLERMGSMFRCRVCKTMTARNGLGTRKAMNDLKSPAVRQCNILGVHRRCRNKTSKQ